MWRRDCLAAVGVVSAGFAGCLGATAEDDDSTAHADHRRPPADTTASSEGSPSHVLQVSLVGDAPAGVEPVAADEAGLTENEYIAAALERASDEYEPGIEDDLGESDTEILASITGEVMPGVDDKLESGAAYVEYEEVVYLLIHIVLSLETQAS